MFAACMATYFPCYECDGCVTRQAASHRQQNAQWRKFVQVGTVLDWLATLLIRSRFMCHKLFPPARFSQQPKNMVLPNHTPPLPRWLFASEWKLYLWCNICMQDQDIFVADAALRELSIRQHASCMRSIFAKYWNALIKNLRYMATSKHVRQYTFAM